MSNDIKSVEHLNRILGNELIAINQYFLHAKMYHNWGFNKLYEMSRKESIEEMQHADKLADRILFLEGIPNFQKLGKVSIGQTPKEALECDLRLEEQAIPDLKAAIEYLDSVQDFASGVLLKQILADEEAHADFIKTQLELIDKIGLENYLQTQI